MAVRKLDMLISRIGLATLARGRKSQLAEFLSVSPQQLNHWLAGVREPGGEYALQMLDWVTAEEAKQESPGSAITPPRPKTRRKQSSHEKPTSGRRKK